MARRRAAHYTGRMSMREVTIDELIERYEALLFDAYGVLTYSVGALAGGGGADWALEPDGQAVLCADKRRLGAA